MAPRGAAAFAAAPQAVEIEAGYCLVLGDAGGFRAALVAALAASSLPIVVAESAQAFDAVDARHYRLRTDAREDLARLLGEAGAAHGPLRRVFHLWSLEEHDAAARWNRCWRAVSTACWRWCRRSTAKASPAREAACA